MKRNHIIIGLIIIGLIFNIGCSTKAAEEAANIMVEQSVTIETAKAVQGDIESLISYSGRIKPVQEITITPKQPGKVVKINYEIGQEVKAGDVLYQLDDIDARLQVNQTAAAVELSEINVKKISGSTYEQQIAQLKSALVAAEVAYDNAKTSYESVKALYEAGAESKFKYDQAESQLRLTEQQYLTAKTNYDSTEQKSALENIATAKAQLDQSKAAYDIAKNALENTSIKSPISGIVAARNVKVGEFVSSAAASYVIIDNSAYTIEVDVNEAVIGKVQIGDIVKVFINSISQEALSGTITAAAPSADLKKQTYLVKIQIDNPPSEIKGGMFAEVKLIQDKAADCIMVPLTSIVEEDGGKYVFVVNEDKVSKTQVDTGVSNDKEVQIISGINVNDEIVVKGQDFLKDGSTVVISNN